VEPSILHLSFQNKAVSPRPAATSLKLSTCFKTSRHTTSPYVGFFLVMSKPNQLHPRHFFSVIEFNQELNQEPHFAFEN
jgi:hypothetical protein